MGLKSGNHEMPVSTNPKNDVEQPTEQQDTPQTDSEEDANPSSTELTTKPRVHARRPSLNKSLSDRRWTQSRTSYGETR